MPEFIQNPDDSVAINNYNNGMEINNVFGFHPGVCVLPIAEDPPTSLGELKTWSPVVILRLHAPYRIRRTRYAADKSNAPPVMPSPQADSGKLVFIGGEMGVSTGMNSSFGAFDWNVTTEFSYVEDCVSRTQDGFVLGSPPWLYTSTAAQSFITPPADTIGLVGAISEAGLDALVGVSQALNITQNGGFDNPLGYIYTVPSYLPKNFFSTSMMNGDVASNVQKFGA